FLRFVVPIVDTLRELGTSGYASEVTDRVIERMAVTESEQEETTSNGQSRVRNQIGWARFYLVKEGLLDASRRGVWTLTERGRSAQLDADSVLALFKGVQKRFPRKPPLPDTRSTNDAEEEPAPEGDASDHRAGLLA